MGEMNTDWKNSKSGKAIRGYHRKKKWKQN